MASQEHLQQLAVEDSSTSSEESSGREESILPPPPSTSTTTSMGHPKMRLKLSLKQTSPDKTEETATKPPTPAEKGGDVVTQEDLHSGETKRPLHPEETSPNDGSQEDEEDDVPMADATIVDSGDDANNGGDDSMDVDEDIQEAIVVSMMTSKPSPTSSVAASATSSAPGPSKTTTSRRSNAPTLRPAKMPPMPSPGLLVHPKSDGSGFETPVAVFDQYMATAGYTTERRTENPHRGSSVTRTVGDMFDSEVHFSLHFPELVPGEFWDRPVEKSDSKDKAHLENGDTSQEKRKKFEMAELLVAALSAPSSAKSEDNRCSQKQLLKFSDMAPLSMTIPYPDSYIKKQVEYVQQVDSRERAIIASQEAKLAAEEAQAKYEEMLSRQVEGSEPPVPPPIPAPVHVPPIPEPPSPPRVPELQDTHGTLADLDETEHPLYPPKGTKQFIEHLDKGCFHITNGRYFGLMSNTIADPQFVGPSAPGIQGLSFTAASGLSTCSGSSGVGLGTTLSHHGSSMATTKGAAIAKSVLSKKIEDKTMSIKKKSNGSSMSSSQKTVGDQSPSSSLSSKLKQIMEAEDSQSEAMQKCILRAAVYACRTEKHRMSFVGVDGEVYPDISKAFATYAGIRPCDRCKTNKQGSYHCRLRRQHKGLDYDGGNSPALLAPLFQEPLDQLLTGK